MEQCNLIMFKLNKSNADREDVEALVRDVGVMANVNSVLVPQWKIDQQNTIEINSITMDGTSKGKHGGTRSEQSHTRQLLCTQEKIIYKQLLEKIKQKTR